MKPLRLLPFAFALLAIGCTALDNGDVHGPKTSYANAVAAIDLDGDTRADLIAASGLYQDGTSYPGYASVVRQTAPATYAAPARYNLGADPTAIAIGDVNNDLRPDIVVANASSGTVSVYVQSATTAGSFTLATTLSTGSTAPLDVAIGDLNGDGLNDIAVATSGNNTVMVFFQSATTPGTFGAGQTFTVAGDPRAIAIGSFGTSGRTDMAVATNADNVCLLLQGATAGTFSAGPVLATGPDPVALRAADLGTTGRLDLVTANWKSSTTSGITVLRQTAPGVFAAGVSYDIGDYAPSGLAIGDLDGDLRPDIVVACAGLPGDPGSVAILTNVPASPGTFAAPVNYRGAYGPLGVAIGDLNGDGLPDLVVADGVPYVRFQQAGFTFGPRTSIGY
jgi:hypothetical protein